MLWPFLPTTDHNYTPGLEVIKRFSCSNQLSIKFQPLLKTKFLKNTFHAFKLSGVVFIMLANVKYMSMINFMHI